jgi:hypothetical protein
MNADTCVSTEPQPPAAVAPAQADAKKRGRQVDLSAIPWNIPWALLDEHEAAAVLHQSVKVLRRQRHEGVGPRYTKLNGCTVRYKLADLQAWLASQPTGGGTLPGTRERRGPGRPRKAVA